MKSNADHAYGLIVTCGLFGIMNENAVRQIIEKNKPKFSGQYALEEAFDSEKESSESIITPFSLRSKYLFLRLLGKGAQAKVYLALRLSDQKHVAIKQLNIDSVKSWKDYELFGREAKALESLNVPGVARFYDAIECLEDRPPCSYIVQEYIEGVSVAKMIKDGHRFRVTDVYDILLQVLEILNRLQSREPPMIHRDIKPSNLMITPNEDGSFRVTLIDFGAVANPQVQSGGSTLAGTFGYMPPEQLMGKPVPASDVFSLGAVAVQLFSGKSPADLPMKDFRIIFESEMEQMPPALIHTLRKMLEPKTEERLCDLPALIDIFTKFKNDDFRVVALDAELSKDLNQQLQQVKFVGENGNMDLWQKLPDQAPRAIPEILNHQNIFLKVEEDLDLGLPAKRDNGALVAAIAGLGITFVFIFIIQLTLLAVLGLLFTVWMFIKYFVPSTSGKPKSLASDDLNYHREIDASDYEERKRPHVNFSVFQRIIREGRKTVATIVDVKYCHVPKESVIEIESETMMTTYQRERHPYVCTSQPAFKLQYKFNPPDDNKEDDLIHECIVHTEPENYYKVGDPLPIIYLLANGYFSNNVYSMMFPFPLDNVNLDELICMEDLNVQKNTPIEKTIDYTKFFYPLVQNKDNPKELIKNIELIPMITDVRVGRLFLGVVTEHLENSEFMISSSIVSSMCESIHKCKQNHSNQKLADLYTNYLSNYFLQKPRKVSAGAVNGVLCYNNMESIPDKIWDAIMDVYLDSDLDKDIFDLLIHGTKGYLNYMREYDYARIPMRYVPLFFKHEQFREAWPCLFLAWNNGFVIGRESLYKEDLDAYLHAAVEFFNRNLNDDVSKNIEVFKAVWYPIYLLNIPEWFWSELLDIYNRAPKTMKQEMSEYMSAYYYLLMPMEITRTLNIRKELRVSEVLLS